MSIFVCAYTHLRKIDKYVIIRTSYKSGDNNEMLERILRIREKWGLSAR